ncbi:MAG: hypothetical protein AAF567_06480 [Actinomycetota bacterium]
MILVFALGILLSGGELEWSWLRPFAVANVALVAVWNFWDRWLWRLRPCQQLKVTPPSLFGTWKGTLASNYIRPGENQAIDPKPAYLVVRQTASSLSFTLMTDESRSVSDAAAIKISDQESTAGFLYLNTPSLEHRKRSPIHLGATRLTIVGKPARKLEGEYWTSRNTAGELMFIERSNDLAHDYEEAQKLFHSS